MPSDPARPDAAGAPPSQVAYFTMEVALSDAAPLYSGGLGVLAGDYLRSAADLAMPVIAVSLLYRGGYFRQTIDATGHQHEAAVQWRPEDVAERLDIEVEVGVGARPVKLAVWRIEVEGVTGHRVPVYLLDSDLAGNHPDDRSITADLYGGDNEHRLRQEAVLGLGGVSLVGRLGSPAGTTFHMNEGHSALLALALLEQLGSVEEVRSRCVFTTHTPVPAGHDRFPASLVVEVLGQQRAAALAEFGVLGDGELNMTELALAASRFANAVSRRHEEVTRRMFPGARIAAITNGVHAGTWTSPPLQAVLDRNVPGWREDNAVLHYAGTVPVGEIAEAHSAAKRALLDEIALRTGSKLDPAALTIGAARRITPYKRTNLLFSDLDRLREIVRGVGPLQVVCSGKAHPRDEAGKAMLADLVRDAAELRGDIEVVFVENYDLGLARLLCSGSDIWLNVPLRPNEASGTSGMKAALNAVPSLSVLDGWWVEGCIEGVTGWAVGADETAGAEPGGADVMRGRGTGDAGDAGDDGAGDGLALYDKLEQVVVPLYYGDPVAFSAVGRAALALNGSFFNTERMAREYDRLAYRG